MGTAVWEADSPVKIGISSCLLGEEVRWNGGHKRDSFLADILGRFVTWVAVCPEVESGLPTPRETLRLVDRGGEVRMVMNASGTDHTDEMRAFSEARVARIVDDDLSGYVLKSKSPSCGMERVKIYSEDSGMPKDMGRGIFADILIERHPLLPVEEEGRLRDARLRDNWVTRVFAYRRLRDLLDRDWSIGDLVAFHSAHKLQLMAHSPEHYKTLGPIVANAKGRDRDDLRSEYEKVFMEGLSAMATTGRHANVMHHILGYFKDELDAATRAELLGSIDDYADGLVPLVVPLTLLGHYVKRCGIEYLAGQTYLEPHPKELMLRNEI